MGKKIRVVKPLERMSVQFNDRELEFCFDMRAITILNDEFGDLQTVALDNINKQCELVGMLFYSGVKPNCDITLEEANVIVVSSMEVFLETTKIVFDSLKILGGDDVEKIIKEKLQGLGAL